MRATMLSALLAAGLLPQGPAAAETARIHPVQVQTTRPVTPGQPLPKLVIGAPGRCEAGHGGAGSGTASGSTCC